MGGGEPPATGEWSALLAEEVIRVRKLARACVPDEPGVYLWRSDGAVVYVGTASSLRGRLWSKHLGRGVSPVGGGVQDAALFGGEAPGGRAARLYPKYEEKKLDFSEPVAACTD